MNSDQLEEFLYSLEQYDSHKQTLDLMEREFSIDHDDMVERFSQLSEEERKVAEQWVEDHARYFSMEDLKKDYQ